MRGYKALEADLSNNYGFCYEIGKTYVLNGKLECRENGFHFCERPEDTLRYVDAFNNDIVIVEVESSGKVVEYENEYFGFYDMYASNSIKIIRILSREEVFDMIINSNEERVKRLICLSKLNQNEKEIILSRYPYLINTINYYQNDEFYLIKKRDF